MSDISVNVTNAGAANVSVSGGSTVNATVGNGGTVSVGIGSISPGNATVVSGTLTINSTTTLAAGSNATVTNKGTAYAAVLDFGIPTGAAGPQGPAGQNGINGVTPSFAIGTVTTGAAGSNAAVTATTSNNGANVTLNLTIPRGDTGASGSNGTGGSSFTLSDSTPSALGTAAAGSSNLAARADHVHALPTIAYSNLSGVPTNFPTNTTLVSGLSSGYSAINHAHNYVTGLNNLTGNLTLAAGSNVTLTANGSTLTISASGGGGGLGANDAVDGGVYIGEILGGITFTTQPQSQTLTVNAANVSFASVSPNIPINSSVTGGVSSFGNRIYATFSDATGYSSADNGATWSQFFSAGAANLSPSAMVPMAFASNGTRTVYSVGDTNIEMLRTDNAAIWADNPSDWTSGSAGSFARRPVGFNGVAVAYMPGAGRFVASTPVFYDGYSLFYHAIVSSSDGENWTVRSSGSVGLYYRHIFVVSGRAVALVRVSEANTTSGDTHTSSDGVTWSSGSLGTTPSAAASSGSRIVVVDNTTSTRHSVDGLTWTTGTLPVACNRISYAAGLFWATRSGTTSTDICTSSDGITWTLRDAGASLEYLSVAAASGSNLAFIVSNSSPRRATLTTGTASANLTAIATASGGQTVSYQWQSSVDAGTSWLSINGATSSALNLTGLTTSDSGKRFRARASATGAATKTSQSATITVTE